MLLFRFIVSPALGVFAAFLFADLSLGYWPAAGTATVLGVLWIFAAGTFGGVACSTIAPAHKIAVAGGTGFLFGVILLIAFFVGRHSQYPSDTNPLLWYWPIWLLPSYLFGGIVGNIFRRNVR